MKNLLTISVLALVAQINAQDSHDSGGKCPLGHDRKETMIAHNCSPYRHLK